MAAFKVYYKGLKTKQYFKKISKREFIFHILSLWKRNKNKETKNVTPITNWLYKLKTILNIIILKV